MPKRRIWLGLTRVLLVHLVAHPKSLVANTKNKCGSRLWGSPRRTCLCNWHALDRVIRVRVRRRVTLSSGEGQNYTVLSKHNRVGMGIQLDLSMMNFVLVFT